MGPGARFLRPPLGTLCDDEGTPPRGPRPSPYCPNSEIKGRLWPIARRGRRRGPPGPGSCPPVLQETHLRALPLPLSPSLLPTVLPWRLVRPTDLTPGRTVTHDDVLCVTSLRLPDGTPRFRSWVSEAGAGHLFLSGPGEHGFQTWCDDPTLSQQQRRRCRHGRWPSPAKLFPEAAA